VPAPVEQVAWRLAALVGLGLAGFALGSLLVSRMLDRLRGEGALGLR
jgi:hypothetical protein